MKKNISLAFMLMLGLGTEAYAQTWIDVTDAYIVNSRFDNNDVSTGWQGTALSQAQRHENAEHYEKNYRTYQTVSGLTAGRYRLSLSAFYRSGSSSEDYAHVKSDSPSAYQHAFLFAETKSGIVESPLRLLCQDTLSTSLGGGTTTLGNWWQPGAKVVPNDMESAGKWFDAGYYRNSLEVTLGEDESELTIGIYKNTLLKGDWTCLDNWKLEYYGTVTKVTGITLSKSLARMNIDESLQLTATVKPSNATYKKVEWISSDESVATVDSKGVVTGVSKGSAKITATATDGSGVTASCTVTVINNYATASSLIINEIMAANTDVFVDPSWNYGGWVELYNPTNTSANIGRFWVSDDPDNLKQAMLPARIGSIPAHGFLTLWFDHAETSKDIGENWLNTNVNMKLNAKGGTVYISDVDGNLIAQQTYPATFMRTSYARTTDGGDTWRFTADPTPTATNITSTFANVQIDDPVVDKAGQLFEGTLQVCVNIPDGAQLRYTTDGTAPTASSAESKDGLFNVSNTTVFRFRLFKDGFLPSNVVTRSYIYKDRDYYLPVISLVTDPANLYDNEIGIYVTGTNGKTANQDNTKRNFNMDWDRPANFEFMETDEVSFSQEVDISIAGGWSRKYEPRSFKVKSAKEYGINELAYPFFQDKPYTKNKSLLLRNGGNDNYNKYRLKDASLQAIARQSLFRLNLQSYRPVHVFLNGDYLAMLNLREPSNKHYGYSNYGIDMDEIDAFEMSVDSGYVQKEGTKDAFNLWYSLAANAADPMAYAQIGDLVDLDDYVNYMAFKFYLYDWDWPHNNTKAFKDRIDGKFHFVTFDLDNCVDWSNGATNNNIFASFAAKKMHTFYARPEYNWTSITAEVEMVTIFLNMLQNEDFMKIFIDTYCLVGGSVFGDEEEITSIVSEMAEHIKPALLWEGNDPTGTYKEQAQGIISAVTGNYRSRMASVIKNYSAFGLSGTDIQALQLSSNVSGGEITFNGMEVPRSKFNGFVFAPVTLKASAPAGYKFAGWKMLESTGGTQTSILFADKSEWKYYTTSLDGTDWKSAGYDDTGWITASAPFGYSNAGKYMGANANTTLARTNAFYVRKTVTLDEEPSAGQTYTFNYSVDDGLLVYVNGTQVGGYHLNSGSLFNDLTQSQNNSWYETDNPATGTITISNDLLKKGKNIIAVEIHNCTSTSSDIWFDGSLTVSTPVVPEEDDADYVSTDEEYELPESGDFRLQAVYTKLSDAERYANGITPVRINEVSAANSIYVNDLYKRNDWVELYNTTDSPVDISGMYLSDNASKPEKYQITATDGISTVIPAFGYTIVWCDKLSPVSQLHASFKLAADGGLVMITAEDGTWADTLSYGPHSGTESFGRYPDGSNNIYAMSSPTIGKTNHFSSCDTLYSRRTDTDVTGIGTLIARNGDMSIMSADGFVTVTAETTLIVELSVYSVMGVECVTKSLDLSSGSASFYVSDLPAGVYIARAKNADGEYCSCKFIVK